MASSIQPPSATARASPGQGRTFRVQNMPLEWTKHILSEHLQHLFPEDDFRVDSLCKHPTNFSSTALVTFSSAVPETLSPLTEPDGHVELPVGDCEMFFTHCHGLTTLLEPGVEEPPKADVIFVHGLGGHAIGSWTAANGKCWPRDFLGNDLVHARVLSFGYEAKLQEATSTSRLSDYGQQLLGQLLTFRDTPEDQQRPLFLIGHSFGGTIINWTLHELYSKRDERDHGDTLKAIRCATFFGTPHQGMSITYLEPLTKKREHESMTRTLHDLQQDSEVLRMLRDTLKTLQKDIRFITCVEQKLTLAPSIDGQQGKGYQAVSVNSAQLYTQDEDIISINADHRKMIKFGFNGDMQYRQVIRHLKRTLENCRPKVPTLNAKQTKYLLNSLAFPEIEERQTAVKDAHEATCEWLPESPQYMTWSNSPKGMREEAPFLWIKGKSGSGKSTKMKFAINHHRSRPKDGFVIAFFFDDRGTDFQKTTRGMYQSLLLQVLKQADEIPCKVFDPEQWIQDEPSTLQTSVLKERLGDMIPRLGRPLFCFVDALDECQSSDVADILAFFERISRLCAEKRTFFRVCFSSRQDLKVSAQRRRLLCLEEQEGHNQDILRYIQHKLHIGYGELTQDIQQALQRKASGVFLWAVLAVEILQKETTWDRMPSFQERLDEIPADLCELYRHVLTDGSKRDSHPKQRLCLQWVLLAKKPLTPMQLYFVILSATDPDAYATLIACPENEPTEDSARKFILGASEGLVEITRGREPIVRFIHKSVLNFLFSDRAVRQVWREKRDKFCGKIHDGLKHCCRDILSSFSSPTPESSAKVEYPDYGHWRDDQECHERRLGFPTKHDEDLARGNPREPDELEIFSETGTLIDDDEYRRQFAEPGADFLPPPLDPLSVVSEFAVENILYHANEAERDGVTQVEFLQDFPLTDWIQSVNTLHGQPMYTSNPSLLYILAEQNMPELIASHPTRLSYLEPEQEVYGTPLFVALAKGNIDTIQAFFNLELSRPSQPANFLDQRSTPQKYAQLCSSYIDIIPDLQAHLASQVRTSNTGALSDYKAVTSFMTQPRNEALHMYLLLTGRATLDKGSDNAASLFSWAAEKGRVPFLQSFFSDGGLDLHGEAGATALLLAAGEGHADAVTMLLRAGIADADVRDPLGRTPLSAAIARGRVDVPRVLLASGRADPEARDRDGRSPLAVAAAAGNGGAVELLLAHKSVRVDVNARDRFGRTPLSLAAESGEVMLVARLVRARADPNRGDAGRRSPLSWCAERGCFGVAEYLVRHCRVDKGAEDVGGMDALAYTRWGKRCVKAGESEKLRGYDAVIWLLGGEVEQVPGVRSKPDAQPGSGSHQQRGLQQKVLPYKEYKQHTRDHHEETHHYGQTTHYEQTPQHEQQLQYEEHHYEAPHSGGDPHSGAELPCMEPQDVYEEHGVCEGYGYTGNEAEWHEDDGHEYEDYGHQDGEYVYEVHENEEDVYDDYEDNEHVFEGHEDEGLAHQGHERNEHESDDEEHLHVEHDDEGDVFEGYEDDGSNGVSLLL